MAHVPALLWLYYVMQRMGFLGCRCDACMYGGHTLGVQVVSSGLEEETCPVVDYEECLTPAERLLPPRRQPKPGEPQVQSLLCATPLPRPFAPHSPASLASAPLCAYHHISSLSSIFPDFLLVSA